LRAEQRNAVKERKARKRKGKCFFFLFIFFFSFLLKPLFFKEDSKNEYVNKRKILEDRKKETNRSLIPCTIFPISDNIRGLLSISRKTEIFYKNENSAGA